MLARVGSTCIKTHGPRPAWQHNVDHDWWVDEWARAQAEHVTEQVRSDAAFEHALAQYRVLLVAWETEIASPGGVHRRHLRRLAGRVLASSFAWLILVAVVAA